MQIFSANDAKTRFGEFIDLAQKEPVRVMRFDDDKFVHTALIGGADILVSGDRDLLDLRAVADLAILSPVACRRPRTAAGLMDQILATGRTLQQASLNADLTCI